MFGTTHTIDLPVPPEEVWDALVNPKKLSAWMECAATANMRQQTLHPGDEFSFSWDDETIARTEILSCDVGRHIKATWEWEGDDEVTEIEVTLSRTPNGTTLTLSHQGFEENETAQEHGDNWGAYLPNLLKVLGGPT